MKNLTWQNPEQLFVAQELINKVKSKCCGIKAYEEATLLSDVTASLISEILRGTHKTYRYVLVNALLAKATNGKIDALALQLADGKGGKFDARSLCHNVVVPFEKLSLPGCLGGSNEPFLNKPARFVSLSMKNAVRSYGAQNEA